MSSFDTAVAVLGGLYAGGVREVVLAPGSRSTPLALAAWAADAAGDLRLHTRVDERSAGFLALGLTIGSRRPVAVVTTSGTAVGNLLPAVMEAHHSGRPLIVVSADRPDRLRGTGANQTTDQAGLFGRFAPCTDLRPGVTPAVAAQAAANACRGPGPAQLNVQLDGSLVPPAGASWWPGSATDLTEPEPSVDRAARPADAGAVTLPGGVRTVVVAGDDAGPAARELAERAGWPLLAEPTSGARTGPAAIRTGALLLRTSLRRSIERVVVVGHPTLSRPVTELVSDPELEILAVRTRTGQATDPGRVAHLLDTVPRVAGGPDEDDLAHQRRWQQADRAVGAAVDAQVDRWAGELPQGLLHPLQVARTVWAALTPGAGLVVGPSHPVRDLDVMAVPHRVGEHRFVAGNRGLAGIDGVVSTAVGVALGRPGRPALGLLGDITAIHDSNGLFLGPQEPRPDLTLLVVDDAGGSIFTVLEQGAPEYAAAFERVFATPTAVDLAGLAAATGTAYREVVSAAGLAAALAPPRPGRGIELVHVRVPRDQRRAQALALAQLARTVVDGAGP